MDSDNMHAQNESPIHGILTGYLEVKNALTNDNGNDAADGGKTISEAMAKLNKSSLPAAQAKAYNDVADDLKENAEHINENSGKIAH
jgi:hypothetical protein